MSKNRSHPLQPSRLGNCVDVKVGMQKHGPTGGVLVVVTVVEVMMMLAVSS